MVKYFLTLTTFILHSSVNVGNNTNAKSDLVEVESSLKEKSDETVILDKLKYVKPKYVKFNIHSATWYNMHGHKTASGEKFHKDSLTAAYNFSKLGSYLRITNVSNNQSVVVKVNDRMGYKGSNHIDLSKCAFDSIGNVGSGRINVIVEEIINN